MGAEQTSMLVASVLFGITAFFCFRISYRQHKEKGFIFTNTWLYASKKEREEMDPRVKSGEYRLARNVFFLLGLMFLVFPVHWVFMIPFLDFVGYALIGAVMVCALVQTISNQRYYNTLEKDKQKGMETSQN